VAVLASFCGMILAYTLRIVGLLVSPTAGCQTGETGIAWGVADGPGEFTWNEETFEDGYGT